jgi:hypothetical protein
MSEKFKLNPAWNTATHRFLDQNTKPLKIGPPPAHELWSKCLEEARKEPRAELTDNRPAIRAALREARMKRTKLVRSVMP